MSEGLSRSKRLAIAVATTAYAAAYVAAAMWLIELSLGLDPKGLSIVVVLIVIAFVLAPAAFPFWRSTLGRQERLDLYTSALAGGLVGTLLTWIASSAAFDPNVSTPLQDAGSRLFIAVGMLVGTLAGAFVATGAINQPPPPVDRARELRAEKQWADFQRKGRARLVVEMFCGAFVGWMVAGSCLSVLKGGWTALQERWTGPDAAQTLAIAALFACWMAFNVGVRRWNDLARRHGTDEGAPLTTRSA